jgi:hypothetical protein
LWRLSTSGPTVPPAKNNLPAVSGDSGRKEELVDVDCVDVDCLRDNGNGSGDFDVDVDDDDGGLAILILMDVPLVVSVS